MKALTFFAVCAASIAIAQTPPLAMTRGEGVAVSANGVRAQFDFEVARRASTTSNTPQVRGRFAMAIALPNSTPTNNLARRIHMPNAMVLGVNGHNAEFGGPATMTIPTPNGLETINGRVQVNVADLRLPDAPATATARDAIRVRFFRPSSTSPNGQMVFDYSGTVARGDIVVRVANPTTP
ncbi:MAG: hypothetical protein JNK63_10885 [Chthonomonas sp.]|nr:hypothetical protein [Chthonomonas sp.]